MARKQHRAKLISRSNQLEKQDQKQGITRLVEVSEPYQGPVDYEKLWRNMRFDSNTFWQEFLKVQEKLCVPCKAAFVEAMQKSQLKAYGCFGNAPDINPRKEP